MNNKPIPKQVSLVVNGDEVRVDPKAHSSLLAYLRSELQLTGCKQGCSTGNCGACTVLIDGHATQSCQIGLGSTEQIKVETIEHLVRTTMGKKITHSLTQYDAAQCGYCLPGIVVAACAEMLTADSPNPVHALQNNLCRCGTHSRILNALQDVMTNQRHGEQE